MIIKQLSIFIENQTGRLAMVTKLLASNNINISALSVADTKEFGILRLIVSDPDKAVEILRKEGVSVSLTDVMCLSVQHSPGTLANALKVLFECHISVEYMYAFAVGQKASTIFKVNDIEKAIQCFEKSNLEVLKAEEVYKFSD